MHDSISPLVLISVLLKLLPVNLCFDFYARGVNYYSRLSQRKDMEHLNPFCVIAF